MIWPSQRCCSSAYVLPDTSSPHSRGSCRMTNCWSSVERTSNSKPSHPARSARSNAACVFSGTWGTRAPRCPNSSGRLVEIKVADGFARVRRFLRLLHGFLKLLLQQVSLVFLCLHRLPEHGFAAVVLLLHGARRFFYIVEGFRHLGRGVGDHSLGLRVHLQHRIAARASNFEGCRSLGRLGHNVMIPQNRWLVAGSFQPLA